MSFAAYKDLIEPGDTVILYINFNMMYPIVVSEKKQSKSGEWVDYVQQTSYGALKVWDLVGKRFGTKVRLSRGYGYALYPTPELWTKTLPHRTQILYATDISMILTQLELCPGCVVIESGTGSGSLSHSLARTIAPNGHLYTFDFHEKRVETAREEFKSHQLDSIVTAQQKDVCSEGFGLEDVADAVFLDLPHPWSAIPFAKQALKTSGGRICSFSPCIEQVQKACEALRKEGFVEISTMECLLREFQVKKITLPLFDENRESKEIANEKKRKLSETNEDEPGNDNEEAGKETKDKEEKNETAFISGIPLLSMPGHTGYLTFATLQAKKSKFPQTSDCDSKNIELS